MGKYLFILEAIRDGIKDCLKSKMLHIDTDDVMFIESKTKSCKETNPNVTRVVKFNNQIYICYDDSLRPIDDPVVYKEIRTIYKSIKSEFSNKVDGTHIHIKAKKSWYGELPISFQERIEISDWDKSALTKAPIAAPETPLIPIY